MRAQYDDCLIEKPLFLRQSWLANASQVVRDGWYFLPHFPQVVRQVDQKMSNHSLYDILEVNPAASPEAIRASYTRLATRLREFGNLADEDVANRLVALREAFLVLNDRERRRRYDRELMHVAVPVRTDDGLLLPLVKFLALLCLSLLAWAGYARL